MEQAKEQGVLQIALEATDMGRPLYERHGFVKMEDEMELIKLQEFISYVTHNRSMIGKKTEQDL